MIRYKPAMRLTALCFCVGFLLTCEGTSTTYVREIGPVAAVEITPEIGTVEMGQTLRLTAIPKDASGNELHRRVTWNSLDPSLVQADCDTGSGQFPPTCDVVGIAWGTAAITATSESIDGMATVEVPDPRARVCSVQSQIPEEECLVLGSFYEATHGRGWSESDGWWVNTTPCSWHGLQCEEGSVTVLEFFDDQLTGTIPPEIALLSNLETLRISTNQLTGPIPPELGNLSNLEALDLSYNQLTANLPPEMGNLTNLRVLNLEHNQLSGSIPTEWEEMSSLHTLGLGWNQLGGVIPPNIARFLGQIETCDMSPGNEGLGIPDNEEHRGADLDGDGLVCGIRFGPIVISMSPSGGGGPVGLLQDFTLTFSEPMDPATLNASTVTVSPMTGSLHMTYSEAEATLWVAPDSLFPPGTNLTLSVGDGVISSDGVPMTPFSANFTTGPMECSYLMDRLEPNDEYAAPVDVPLDTWIVGLSTCMDDEDYYRITLPEWGEVSARVDITYAQGVPWEISWRMVGGSPAATRGGQADTGERWLINIPYEPGSHILKISGPEDEPLVLYDLFIASPPFCADDAYENNDFKEEAKPISTGSHSDLIGCYVDPDWFSFPVLAGQTIEVGLDKHGDDAMYNLYVEEPGGEYDSKAGVSAPTASVSVTATANGTAFVRVILWAEGIPYQMEISVGSPEE